MANRKAASAATTGPGVQFAALGQTFTATFGTAAMIAIQTELKVPIDKIGEAFKSPTVATLRDLLAAALVRHHPQLGAKPTGPAAQVMAGTLGVPVDSLPASPSWAAQVDLAEQIMDDLGLPAVAELFGETIAASKHFTADVPKAA